jgi:type I restriction enzyme M protein
MNLQELIQATLWDAGAKVFKETSSAGRKLCVPGLVFLKYMSHAFDHGAGDAVQVEAKNLLRIPRESRWEYVLSRVNRLGIGTVLNKAMESIERFNPPIQRILPREYTSPDIREDQLALFIKKLGEIPGEYFRTGEILQQVYGFFVRNLPASGEKGPEPLSTPECVDKLLVEIVGPVRGSIFDPCCGVGGLLVESRDFIARRQGTADGTVFYGQESRCTNFRLCRMNMAIHDMDGTRVRWSGVSSLDRDLHPGVKADYILCAPPYNRDVSGWLHYINSHLALNGRAGVVLSNDSLTTGTEKREEVRKFLVEQHRVDCIVALPDQLFRAAGMPACLWILGRGKSRKILFIDVWAGVPGNSLVNRRLTTADISHVAGVYRNWRDRKGYKDEKGFCRSVTVKTVRNRNYDLSPERYV